MPNKSTARGSAARDPKACARSVRRKTNDAPYLTTLSPDELHLHVDAALPFAAWRDLPRITPPPEAARAIALAVVESGPCLAVRLGGEIRIVSGFDVVDAAVAYGLPVEVVVLPGEALDATAIRRLALSQLARLPAIQLDPEFGHAGWLVAVRRCLTEELRRRWFGGALSRAGAARLMGVCRDRLAPARLGRPS